MKVTVYLRVAQGPRAPRVAASTKPNYAPLQAGTGWSAEALPTAAFAVRLDIPEEAFERARQVLAEIAVPDDQITVAAIVGEDETEA